MKHINSFHGSISALLLAKGLDSKAILSACNAYRGSVKANPDDGKVTSETKLSGKVTTKGDGRRLSFIDKETSKAKTEKGAVAAPGLLIALSDALLKLTESHGATVSLTEFPVDIEDWLEMKREVFARKEAAPTAPTASAETVPASAS